MGILKMRGSVIALLAAVAVNAQDGGKIRQDTISYVQSLGDDIDRLSDSILPNGTFDASFGSFDEIQKFVFEQIDNGLNFATDTINLVADLMERACWTFDTQFEQYIEPWSGVDFCSPSYIDNATSSIDQLSTRVEQWADTTDVWVLAFKYAL